MNREIRPYPICTMEKRIHTNGGIFSLRKRIRFPANSPVPLDSDTTSASLSKLLWLDTAPERCKLVLKLYSTSYIDAPPYFRYSCQALDLLPTLRHSADWGSAGRRRTAV